MAVVVLVPPVLPVVSVDVPPVLAVVSVELPVVVLPVVSVEAPLVVLAAVSVEMPVVLPVVAVLGAQVTPGPLTNCVPVASWGVRGLQTSARPP